MSNGTIAKVFGGSPLGVLCRLVLVSVLVGVVLVGARASTRGTSSKASSG